MARTRVKRTAYEVLGKPVAKFDGERNEEKMEEGEEDALRKEVSKKVNVCGQVNLPCVLKIRK